MIRRSYESTVWQILCAFSLALGIVLGGCTSENDIAAAQGRKIETYSIAENSFLLQTDLEPDIEISDGTTKYTLNSDGKVSFTPMADTNKSLLLKSGEIVIERPGVRAVTVIRFN